MKLGVAYIVFDGVELLEHSIDQIRPHVDFITVIYQTRSWFGKEIRPEDSYALSSLKARSKINNLSQFTAFSPLRDRSQKSILTSKSYERAKRQMGLSVCLAKGCTHFLCMDVDEFYDGSQFAAAKAKITSQNLGSTAAKFINYVKRPTLHRGYDQKSVPFVCRVSPGSRMSREFFVKCDPTRGISPRQKPEFQFDPSELTMHHMETVRKDLSAKYESTTRGNFDRTRTRELVNIIDGIDVTSDSVDFNRIIYPGQGKMRLVQCENRFNLPTFN